MPTYNNALTNQPANPLAYPGGIGKRGGSLDSFVPLDYSRLAAGQFRQDTPQMREYAANVPIDVLRGRFAGMLGFPSDVLNMVRTPLPMEMFGQTDYEQPTQVPYGTEQLLKTLPLAPAADNPLGQVANRVGSFVPITPMEALQAARVARQAAMATGRFVAPKAGQLAEGYMQRMGMMPSIVPVESASVASVNQLPQALIRPKAEVSPLGFYSAVEQQALNIPRKSGTGASFINDLMKGQDVKKYEIEAMGLDEFLKDKPNVTRQEVQDFIQSNRVNVQEKQLGGAITEDPVGIAKRKAVFDKYEPQIQSLYKEMDNPSYVLVDRQVNPGEYQRGVMLQNRVFRGESVTAQEIAELEDITNRFKGKTVKEFSNDNEARSFYLGMSQDERLRHSIMPKRNATQLQTRINEIQDLRDAEANAAYVVPEPTPTKYNRYQLPGGDNYREILLTTPVRGKSELDVAQIAAGDLRRQTADLMEQWKAASELNPGDPSVVALYQRVADSRRLRDQAETKAQELKNQIGLQTYQSSHFNEPNVLAHMRVNDRIDADGKKMLLIEEVQSDWHQAGREKGYAGQIQQLPNDYKIQSKTDKNGYAYYEVIDSNGNIFAKDYSKEGVTNQAINRLNESVGGVPDAPFKDTWHQLALKRAIKEAVDKGYDRIGLTTGKQQIDRFSNELRQNVDEINFQTGQKLTDSQSNELQLLRNKARDKGLSNLTGTERQRYEYLFSNEGEYVGKNETKIKAFKGSNSTFSGTIKDGKFIEGPATGKTVEEVFGKSMAKQIAEQRTGTIKGDDLTIGGEGMKKYYDEVYPAFLEKQGKKYGAKVGETRIKTGRGVPGGEAVRYLDITPEMRKAVKEGQPLASMQNELANQMA